MANALKTGKCKLIVIMLVYLDCLLEAVTATRIVFEYQSDYILDWVLFYLMDSNTSLITFWTW